MKSALKTLVGLSLLFATLGFAQTHSSIPKGEITKYVFDHSTIFPGTTRHYWIYVPHQYDPSKPACLLVDQDGIQFKAPAVMDELIANGEMPVTIGVFVQPGRVPAPSDNALPRFNRSVEYDGLGDDYVRFLTTELLPEIEKQTTRDGRPIRISHNATDRAIMGSSSGGIAAFTAAWERPDQFSRVFTAIGTYVNQRGGNIYPSLIRKFEPKPIRVFLQDGSADHNLVGGNWFLANQEMESALTFAGYEVNHTWGTGDHDDKQATQIFPDVMRWLWKDWPTPPKAGLGSPQLQQILIPDESWQMATRDMQRWFVKGWGVMTPHGAKAWVVSPDRSLLYADDDSHWVYSYQIQEDGALKYKQRFYDLCMPETAPDSGAGGMCVDRDGRLYVATRAGVQICDQAGRVQCIIPIPGEEISDVCFSGADETLLCAKCGEKYFVRKLKVRGMRDGDAPTKPAPPHL